MLIPMGFLAASGAGGAGAYELIESAILTTTTASVTFSSIPQTYKHLQIRYVGRSTRTAYPVGQILAQFNGVTSGYPTHEIRGTNGAVSSVWYGAGSGVYMNYLESNASTTNLFAPGVVDILDYSSTTKNKTVRSLSGKYSTASGDGIYPSISMTSSAFLSTAAITSMLIFPNTDSFAAGTRISLYGIKGA